MVLLPWCSWGRGWIICPPKVPSTPNGLCFYDLPDCIWTNNYLWTLYIVGTSIFQFTHTLFLNIWCPLVFFYPFLIISTACKIPFIFLYFVVYFIVSKKTIETEGRNGIFHRLWLFSDKCALPIHLKFLREPLSGIIPKCLNSLLQISQHLCMGGKHYPYFQVWNWDTG